MMLKSQERSQRQPDVIALRSRLARLASFDSAKLLDAPMIGLYGPRHILKLHALKLTHFQFVGRPVFNVAVLGHELEYFDETVSLQMKHGAGLSNLDFADPAVALAVGINLPITLELRQPEPPQIANDFEVIEAPVPAIEQDTGGLEASLFSGKQHLAKMIILRRPICRLVKEAIVTRNVTVAIGPQKRNQINAAHDFAMFARPMAADEFNLFGVLLVERRIIQDQYASVQFNLMTGFLPEVFAIGVDAQQQAVDGIVSRRVILVWLHPRCFCAAIDSGGGNQKINIVVRIAFWSIHT